MRYLQILRCVYRSSQGSIPAVVSVVIECPHLEPFILQRINLAVGIDSYYMLVAVSVVILDEHTVCVKGERVGVVKSLAG
jgi:hypothetical protein